MLEHVVETGKGGVEPPGENTRVSDYSQGLVRCDSTAVPRTLNNSPIIIPADNDHVP
jgi:hypothetical protein